MRSQKMTSRERVLAALKREPVDYAPCSPGFNPLHEKSRIGRTYQFPWGPSAREQIEYLINELGLDPVVNVGLGGSQMSPGVSSKVWMEDNVIHKVYSTPAGDVEAAVEYDDRWPHGYDIPFYSDFLPAHYTKPWIETEQDLDCFRHILQPVDYAPRREAIRFSFNEAKRLLADKWNLATRAGCGTGLTGALQLFGPTQLCMMTLDNPDLVHGYLDIEHQVSLRNLEIAADLGVDIVTRNGFYETSDFYSPAMLEEFLYDRLQAEIALAHQGGLLVTYLVHTGVMPMLDYLRRLDFDCLDSIGLGFHGVDLEKIRDSQEDTKSFWIGPDNTHHTNADDPEVMREVVRQVFRALGTTGVVLGSCPSIHGPNPWENTLAMVDEWKKLRGG